MNGANIRGLDSDISTQQQVGSSIIKRQKPC